MLIEANSSHKPIISNYIRPTSADEVLKEYGLRLQQETPSSLQRVDEENIRRIQSPVNNQRFIVERPRIVAVGKLDLGFFPDASFAVVADENNQPYAVIHNVECISETLTEENLLAKRVSQVFNDSFFVRPGTIRGVYWWFADTRALDYVEAMVLVEGLPVQINGQEYFLPIIEARGLAMNGELKDCPTLAENILGAIDINDLSTRMGEVLGNIVDGLKEGFQEGRNN